MSSCFPNESCTSATSFARSMCGDVRGVSMWMRSGMPCLRRVVRVPRYDEESTGREELITGLLVRRLCISGFFPAGGGGGGGGRRGEVEGKEVEVEVEAA